MIKITYDQFKENQEAILRNAAAANEFATVQTKSGNAVIISEEEWNILRQGFARLIGGKILD